MSDGRDIFISHVGEDSELAIEIATGLELAGYTTWYYERDCLPGRTNFEQELSALEAARAILLLISNSAISKSRRSREVDIEVEAAHGLGLPFIPVLFDLEWPEFQERQPKWKMVLGSTVGQPVPAAGVSVILPRLVLGLEGLGILPASQAGLPRIIQDYPLPLAATYAHKMAGAVSQAQAFQAHAGLGDVAQATVKFLAVLVLAQYRADSGTPGREDAEVERDLASLTQAGLDSWVSALHGVLSLYEGTSHPLLHELRAYYYGKTHRNNPVSHAAGSIQTWLGVAVPRRAPFTYRDLFEILLAYYNWPEGWSTQRAVLADYGQYQDRVDVLRPALEQALVDLEFLTDYKLVYVQEGRAPPYRLYEATGRDLGPTTESLAPEVPVQPGHLYLCQGTAEPALSTAEGLHPLLDLYPLLVCGRYPGSQEQELFFYHPEPTQQLEYVSYASGHGMAPADAEHFQEEMRAFASLTDWRHHLTDRAAGRLREVYGSALREVLQDGEIDALEQQKLDFLARMLGLTAQQAAQLEQEARQEFAPPVPASDPEPEPVPEGGEEGKTEDLEEKDVPSAAQKPEEAEDVPDAEDGVGSESAVESEAPAVAEVETDAGPAEDAKPSGGEAAPPAAPVQRHLADCWQQPRASRVTHVVLFGTPPMVFTADEAGEILLQGIDGRILVRDRVAERVYRAVALPDRVITGGWDGGLCCFDRNGLSWHETLKSPISALAGAGELVVAGTWDGRIVAFGQDDGRRRWQSELGDGVSALSISAAGEYVAAGSFAGHLAISDAAGHSLWMQSRQSPVVAVLFDAAAEEVLVATRNRICCIRLDNQDVVWEQAMADILLDMDLSPNGRRLAAAFKGGQALLWNVNGAVSLRSDAHRIEELVQVALPAVSADGPLTLLVSRRHGLYTLDNRTLFLSQEAETPAQCMSVSADGRHVVVGGDAGVALFRLARPELRVALEPSAALIQGRATRLKIVLENVGEQPARDIELALEGPVHCTRLQLPRELAAGARAESEKQTLRPEIDGTLPLTVRLCFRDDLGIEHQDEQVHLLDAQPAPGRETKEGTT